jgi:hypothetical protein
MKVVNQVMFVSVQNDIVCGDGSFKATVEHQIIVSNEGVDVEFSDIVNITFMGMPINGYKAYSQFKEKMLDMGIDIEAMVEEECVGLITDSFINTCKDSFNQVKFIAVG